MSVIFVVAPNLKSFLDYKQSREYDGHRMIGATVQSCKGVKDASLMILPGASLSEELVYALYITLDEDHKKYLISHLLKSYTNNQDPDVTPRCCVCDTTENLHRDGEYGWRCSSVDCVCF